jgi:alkyl sulfatase BDS1-like metallo-beta-lactamase superfamily hydrolase
VNHNVKAIDQRYLGWYDGNPAHLWQHPPEAGAARYVEALGGIDATVAKARDFLDRGDLRFAAELANHAIFAAPDHQGARDVQIEAFERIGFGAENATWRNCFLTGADELRNGVQHTDVNVAGLARALTITQLFDSVAIRVVGERAWQDRFSITWRFPDTDEEFHMELSNGVLVHFPTARERQTDLTVTLTKPQLVALLGSASIEGVEFDGDTSVIQRLVGLLESPDPDFEVVTP